MTASGVNDGVRDRLRIVADVLIPAAHGMPSASDVGVADAQLDRVVAVRPDLGEDVARALARVDLHDVERSVAQLETEAPALHQALVLTIVGGYYIHPEIRRRLDYDGQVPVEVRPEIIPPYVEEGLLDDVVGRGPIYRTVPDESEDP